MNSVEIQTSQSRLEKAYRVRQIKPLKYEGLIPLGKPSPNSRGVYGGNLCGQAIVVAMETVDKEFTPHSLHSYFIKAGDDSIPCQYEVEKISDGKNFANRVIRVVQNDELKYIVMISLTKKNTFKKSMDKYENGKLKNLPLDYQAPVPEKMIKYNHSDLRIRKDHDHSNMLHHKFVPDFYNSKLAEREELQKPAATRDVSFWIKVNEMAKDIDPKYKYAGMGVLSDSLHLSSLSRILHLPISKTLASGGKGEHFFSISLDHSIYFHDDEFDPSKWVFFNFKAPRFSNNRVFIQGSYYNEKGKLFASIVQEGLVFFHSGSELRAKL